MSKIIKLIKKPLFEKIQILKQLYWRIKTKVWYSLFFNQIGKNTKIIKPLKLDNVNFIILKNKVTINAHSWLLALPTGNLKPNLQIEEGATIGHFNHITCIDQVYIGKNVLTADKVYISDNYHGYEDIKLPINEQPIKSKGKVYIGENTWIGENVSIISSVVGKNCIIGANSVVTRDIPDYSIAVGSPAKVIKKYNFKTQKWEQVKES